MSKDENNEVKIEKPSIELNTATNAALKAINNVDALCFDARMKSAGHNLIKTDLL